MAIIDTGADKCAFPKFAADSTGHILKGKGVKSSFNGGISGTKTNTWKHTFRIGILDPLAQNVLKMSGEILVDCFEHNNAPLLLGGNDFLIDLRVSFDYPNQMIKIEW